MDDQRRLQRADPDNLSPAAFPAGLDWSPDKQEEALRSLYSFVVNECSYSIAWHYRKKVLKSLFGFWLRLGSIPAFGIAGLIPLLADLLSRGLRFDGRTVI